MDQFPVLRADAFPSSGQGPRPMDMDRTKELDALVGRVTLENEFPKAAPKKGAELHNRKPCSWDKR